MELMPHARQLSNQKSHIGEQWSHNMRMGLVVTGGTNEEVDHILRKRVEFGGLVEVGRREQATTLVKRICNQIVDLMCVKN